MASHNSPRLVSSSNNGGSDTNGSVTPTNPSSSRRSSNAEGGLHFKLPSLHHSQEAAEKSPIPLSSAGNLPVSSLTQLTESNWAQRPEDFDIQKPIGYGSSAVVYAAVYKPLNKRVAIKMIDLDMFERNQIDELRRETALMALSKHPNVLRVYGSFVCGSKLHIVTPYLSGGSCLDIMKTAFPDGFEEISIATILKQALEGIVYLHKNGHIHRDVKAGNLLMDEQGTVLLADFGVSSSLTENNELRKTFVGTPCWMAPEVMEQAGYDYKADIWSFGITAIELATGHAPFAKYPPMKVLMMTLSNAPPTLDRENAKHKYSKTFKEMIDMCLQKDPKKRPTAEKLLQHSFFKEAKKKDYLVKSVLSHVPPLDRRPHKKVPQKHVAVETTEQWDFDTQSDAPVKVEQRPLQTSPSLQEPVSSTEPTPAATPKKHISFGEVVIRNPPQPHSGSPHTESPPSSVTTSPEIAAPAPVKKSRFLVEESRDSDHANSYASQRSMSPSTDDNHPPGSPYLSPQTNADANETPTGLGISSSAPASNEVKKGRFSVNQTAPRSSTPVTTDDGTDHSMSVQTHSSTPQDIRPVSVARVSSHDSLPERKSRFEIQHKTPPSNQSSVHGSQELHVKFDSLPLSRENSISVSREPSCHGKVSRFSVEKEERDGGSKDSAQQQQQQQQPHHHQQQQQPCEYPTMSPECRKKGRFELTGGSSTSGEVAKHDPAHHVDSPQSSLSGSPSTSPCSSLSRGQTGRLFDPSMPQMMQSHMETLLKQLDAQKSLVQDMMLGMSMVYGTPTSSDARSVQARSRASSSDSKRSHGETPQEVYRSRSSSVSAEIITTVEHLQHIILNVSRERDKFARENEALKKEVERLRRQLNESNNAKQ